LLVAALAVSRRIEHAAGWSIRKFLKTARRYPIIKIGPDSTSPLPPTRSPTNSARPSKHSTAAADLAH
jgi:hypothetical protein